jgi:uncharacterized protein YmfQ (DUF2313 family)
MKPRAALLNIVIAAMTVSVPISAAYGAEREQRLDDGSRFSDRDNLKNWKSQEDTLERALKTGESKDFYRRELTKMGWQITSVNYDKPDYLEYEIVKGNDSYEVQIDFDKNSNKASKVDVSMNVWKTDATENALANRQKVVYPNRTTDNPARFSDRQRMTTVKDSEGKLEQALKTGESKDFYRRELEKTGWSVTSVNYDKPDYLEYEIVKGDESFEVQIDFDKNSNKATKVDVTVNAWKTDATENALANRKKAAYPNRTTTDPERFSDRQRMTTAKDSEGKLEQALKTGEGKDFYRRELEKLAWQIPSVNYDKPDYLEYEIVKGDESFEVQIDFDKNSNKATKVDVTMNAWKTDATKKALANQKMMDYPNRTTDNPARFSDRQRMTTVKDSEGKLEQALKTGESKAFYRRELEKLGWKVTSVNYDKPDYLEYEIVKGDDSFEVQIDFDKNSNKASKVDVTLNAWKTDATKKALKQHPTQARR